MTALQLVETIKAKGGVLQLIGEQVKFQLPADVAHLADSLRQHKAEIIGILRAHGGRVATFPRCPRCLGTALYRENNIGTFECQTCGFQGIPEEIARRVH